MRELEDSAERLVGLARVAVREGRWEDAMASCEGALKLSPRLPSAREMFREALRGAGWLEAPDQERRRLAVIFCDLARSVEVTSRLGAEVWAERLREFHTLAAEVIVDHFDGRIDSYRGDAIHAYFGFPRAHDNDSVAAISAGLAVLERLNSWTTRIAGETGVPFGIRVGVHTGEVLLDNLGGEGAAGARELVGDAPNVAARIQEVAPLNTVVASDATLELAGAYFLAESLGVVPLRGVEDPPALHRVIGPSGVQGRMEASLRLEAPLVAREAEAAALLSTLEATLAGGSGTVLLVGEPGVGKSRLVLEAERTFRDVGRTSIKAETSEFRANTPFYAVGRIVRRVCGVEPSDSPEQIVRKLASRFERDGVDPTVLIPLLAGMLDVSLDETPYSPPDLSPLAIREHTMDGLCDWLTRAANDAPLLCVVEDLHWADDSTVALIARLVGAHIPGLALILTARAPEFDVAGFIGMLPDGSIRVIHVDPLSQMETGLLAQHWLPDEPRESEVIARIASESGGNPLFAEELAMAHRANLAQGQPASSLPSRLSDVLTAKLDRVGRHRALVQTAATIGFEVPRWLLQAASGVSEGELEAGLQAVVEADVLRVDRRRAYRSYVFRHELLRRVAYAQQTVVNRVEHHGRIADALSDEGPPWGEPEVMAFHLSAAERYDAAASAWIGAAERSVAIGAYREAIQHYDRVLGISASSSVPPTSGEQTAGLVAGQPLDRLSPQVRFAVDLQASLGRGSAFAATQGWRSAGTEGDFAHALDLCRAAGAIPALLPALVGLWTTTLVRGDFVSGDALIAMMMETVAGQAESDLLAEVEACAAFQDFYTGRLLLARAHFDTASHLFGARGGRDESGPPTPLRRWALPHEPWCTSLILHAVTVLVLGDPSESDARANEAQLRADALVSALEPASVYHYSAGLVWLYESWRLALRGDPASSAAAAREAIALAQQHGHLELLMPATLHAAIADVRMGSAAEARAGMEAAVAMWRASAGRLLLPYFLMGLAEARLMTGDPDGAVQAIEDAEELTRSDLLFRPEVLRTRARVRVTIDSAATASARDDLLVAIEVAKSMSAKLFELSAACDWVELEGTSAEAHAALASASDGLAARDDSPLARRARSLRESVHARSE